MLLVVPVVGWIAWLVIDSVSDGKKRKVDAELTTFCAEQRFAGCSVEWFAVNTRSVTKYDPPPNRGLRVQRSTPA